MDRYSPPLMGRRHGWLVICQALLIVGLLAMGTLDLARNLAWLAALAIWVAFCSASQDIVFDAYKTDLLPAEERGTGAAVSVAWPCWCPAARRCGWPIAGWAGRLLTG